MAKPTSPRKVEKDYTQRVLISQRGDESISMEWRRVDELVPHPLNARTHSDEQITQLVASMREWMVTNPPLIDEHNNLLAGHGRRLALQKEGVEWVHVLVATGWTEGKKKAYILADNQLALNAGWDEEKLSAALADLQSLDFDIDLIGFGDEELSKLLEDAGGGGGDNDPDAVPEVAERPPVSQKGDVWILGKHRLVCGDSTDRGTVEACLAGVEPHLMVTDPPYGVEYDAAWRDAALKTERPGSEDKKSGGRAVGKVENDDQADWRAVWALFPGDVAYVWHGATKAVAIKVAESLLATGFELRTEIVWIKNHFVMGRSDYHSQHEPCFYAVRKGKAGHYNGDRSQSTCWFIDKPQKSETGHSTQKPVECMRRPIINNSSPGQAIFEPFSGSGTTIIACEMEGRSCHAIELNPAYVDLAVQRWEEFTDQSAVREGDGRSFKELSALVPGAPDPKALSDKNPNKKPPPKSRPRKKAG